MFVTANILQPLIDLNQAILRFFHDSVGFGWGLSIICLTLAIRFAIVPLTFKQVRSMQEMQRFSPEMKRIRERYKEDKQRQNEELMKLYQEHGFNPLGSCLPLVLQLPFFFGLYQTLKPHGEVAKEIGLSSHKGFLFIPDLAAKLTDHKGALVAIIVLYVGSQLASSYVTSINVQDKNQRRLLFIFPFVFVPVVINFPAGLLVYWVTTNFFTIGQQLAVRKFFPPPAPHEGGESSPTPAKERASRKQRPAADGGEPVVDGAAAQGKAKGNGDGKARAAKGNGKAPAAQTPSNSRSNGQANGSAADGARKPPPAPRKKKKRTGRRR